MIFGKIYEIYVFFLDPWTQRDFPKYRTIFFINIIDDEYSVKKYVDNYDNIIEYE